MSHLSDSAVQPEAEPLILTALSAQIGTRLEPRRFTLPAGASADIDGASADGQILVEVFARRGALKGGQRGKIARDALKLITLGQARPGARLILALADEAAAKPLKAKSWLAEALATFNIEVIVVELDAAVRQGIRDAQVRQVMVNTGPATPDATES